MTFECQNLEIWYSIFNRQDMKTFKVSLSPCFHQNALHKKYYKIWIISTSRLRKLIHFFIRVCCNFQRLCGTYMFCYLICNNWSLIEKFILKNGLPSSKRVAFIFFNKKCFKNDQKCISFPFKISLLVLKTFKFLSWLFWFCKKWLDKKTKVSKFMTSQTRILTIAIGILSNFSWRKSSHTMKFILLIEILIKGEIFFLKNLVLISFIEIKIEHISGWTFWNVIDFAVMICSSRFLSAQVSKCRLLAFTSPEAAFF